MKLELRATPKEVMRAVETLEAFARQQRIPEKIRFGLALALEECGSNIVNHALRRDGRKKFHVTLERAGDSFVIELRDRGPAFDPTKAAGQKTAADAGHPPGGWGLQLVRRYTDAIHYRRESGVNILQLVKRLVPESGRDDFHQHKSRNL